MVAGMGFCLGLVIASRILARGAVPTKVMPPKLAPLEFAPPGLVFPGLAVLGVERIPSWVQRAGRSDWTGASFHWA